MKYERWTKKDFTFQWVWHRGRLQGQENNGYYRILWKGEKEINSGFRTKKEAEQWLADFLRKAHTIRKAMAAKM